MFNICRCICLFLLFTIFNCFRTHKIGDYKKDKPLNRVGFRIMVYIQIVDGWRSVSSDYLVLFRSYYSHRISKFEREYSTYLEYDIAIHMVVCG